MTFVDVYSFLVDSSPSVAVDAVTCSSDDNFDSELADIADDCALRWFRSTTQSPTTSTCWSTILDEMHDLASPPYPPGSICDPTRPPSPTDVRDFPDFNQLPPEPSICDDGNLARGIFSEFSADTATIARKTVRTIGLTDDRSRLTVKKDTLGLVNSGANSCVTDTEVSLINVWVIPPVTLILALGTEKTVEFPPCRKMGYLQIPCEDGSEHLQPFLINDLATDTIMSPEAIMNSKPLFHSWQ